MLKQIPKSDINFRPFKVYKTFQFTNENLTSQYAVNHTGSAYLLDDNQLIENGAYHQLKTMYYSDNNSLNPFVSFGDFKPKYSFTTAGSQRKLYDSAEVLKIPQTKFGEGIKKNSIELFLETTNETINDDGFGNLVSDTNTFTLIEFNVNDEEIIFLDADGTSLTLNLWSLTSGYNIDINTGIIYFEDEDLPFTNLIVDIQSQTITFNGLITSLENLVIPNVGNVFYSHGLITLTKETNVGELRYNAFDNFDLSYKSTITIYENEFLLVVGEDEFNASTNPSSYTETNVVTGSINTTFEGVRKWRNSEKYQKAEFSNYEYSSSIDPTGSYLAPYITTIGLYDNNMDMVAVAKLATPIKSMPDLPVNFLVRIDT